MPFELPIPYKASSAIAANRLRKKRIANKRKRDDLSTDNDDVNLETASQTSDLGVPSPSTLSALEYSAVITPEERLQYRVAGHPFDQKVPRLPFPHAPTSIQGKTRTNSETAAHATGRRSVTKPNLHRQHFGALITILHKSLMQKDYERAGQAFGLVLREEFGGHSVDVRDEGLWGIGAEILLHKSEAHAQIDRKGFEDAKKYYERLILQYPYLKGHENAISALDFYIATFGLWIYMINAESTTADEPDDEEMDNVVITKTGKRRTLAVVGNELEQAKVIASRMDACMSAFPFSENEELLRLRAQVALWVANLCETSDISHDAFHSGDDPVENEHQFGTAPTETSPTRSALYEEALAARHLAEDLLSRSKLV